MNAPQNGSVGRCRTADYCWREFPLGEESFYRQAHAYRIDQFAGHVLLLTPWCEEGSLHALRHDRPSVGAEIAHPAARIPRCVRCCHRWNAAVLETRQAESRS